MSSSNRPLSSRHREWRWLGVLCAASAVTLAAAPVQAMTFSQYGHTLAHDASSAGHAVVRVGSETGHGVVHAAKTVGGDVASGVKHGYHATRKALSHHDSGSSSTSSGNKH